MGQGLHFKGFARKREKTNRLTAGICVAIWSPDEKTVGVLSDRFRYLYANRARVYAFLKKSFAFGSAFLDAFFGWVLRVLFKKVFLRASSALIIRQSPQKIHRETL